MIASGKSNIVEPEGVEPEGVEPEGVEPEGVEPEGEEPAENTILRIIVQYFSYVNAFYVQGYRTIST